MNLSAQLIEDDTSVIIKKNIEQMRKHEDTRGCLLDVSTVGQCVPAYVKVSLRGLTTESLRNIQAF